jgi:hypothetical protein
MFSVLGVFTSIAGESAVGEKSQALRLPAAQ